MPAARVNACGSGATGAGAHIHPHATHAEIHESQQIA
jgi:hypothetical protein